MTCQRRIVVAALAAALVAPLAVSGQDLHPSRRPSPMGMARITIGDAYVRVVYGRPTSAGATTSSERRRAAPWFPLASAGVPAPTRPARSR